MSMMQRRKGKTGEQTLGARQTRHVATSKPPSDKPQSQTDAALWARNVLTPSLLAANTIAAVVPTDVPLDIPALTEALGEQARRVIDGDLSRAESMLTAQAHTLSALFTVLTRRAIAQEHLAQYEAHFRLALKAQSQCRATLETLAVLKNPPHPTFVRQANIAHGPQQVNNGTPMPEPSRARESESEPNRLLEQQNGERLDTLPAQATGDADPALEAVGPLDRTQDRRG
jgi:hypothetical protein